VGVRARRAVSESQVWKLVSGGGGGGKVEYSVWRLGEAVNEGDKSLEIFWKEELIGCVSLASTPLQRQKLRALRLIPSRTVWKGVFRNGRAMADAAG